MGRRVASFNIPNKQVCPSRERCFLVKDHFLPIFTHLISPGYKLQLCLLLFRQIWQSFLCLGLQGAWRAGQPVFTFDQSVLKGSKLHHKLL